MTQWCPLVRANLSAARVGWAPDERVAKSKIFTSAEVWVIPVREPPSAVTEISLFT